MGDLYGVNSGEECNLLSDCLTYFDIWNQLFSKTFVSNKENFTDLILKCYAEGKGRMTNVCRNDNLC